MLAAKDPDWNRLRREENPKTAANAQIDLLGFVATMLVIVSLGFVQIAIQGLFLSILLPKFSGAPTYLFLCILRCTVAQ